MGSLNPGSDTKTLVLQATDIVELIGQSVALKRRGKDFLGLCPFHQDKNPSFYVIPTKQIFHCFACKASGNAIDFVMRRDRVEFIEAVRTLAERAGIDLPRRGEAAAQASQRQVLLEAQSAACAFFENQLHHSPAGAPALAYLAKRGFTPEVIRQFRIGMAPDAWDGLLRSPGARKFPPPMLAAAGLLKPRQNGEGFYDTFRNRVMFPIFEEAQARIIAFGGRVMPGSEDPAKYLNSPETPLFSKSRCIYGLNFARQRMIDTGTAVVVEGYTDVVMAHQFGVTNVVSVLGTALTEQHLQILRRFANKIILLFDADEAGGSAADRTVELFLSKDIEIAIAALPDGMDPDECLLKDGAAGFEAVLAQARDVLSYKWDQMVRQFRHSAGDLTGQQKAIEAYLQLLASARGAGPVDPIRWGGALARVSRLTDIPMDELQRKFRKPAAPVRRPIPQPAPESPQSDEPTAISDPVKISRAREVAERQIMGILFKEPVRWHKVQKVLHPDDFAAGPRRDIAEIFWAHQQHEGEPVFNEFLGLLEKSAHKQLAVELLGEVESQSDTSVEATFSGAVSYIVEERQRSHQQKQMAELRRMSQENSNSTQSVEQFERFLKNNQSADQSRLGPVKRSGSGS